MLPTIDILMATYNGAAYLQQQINSLLTQTYDNWQLLVHDDGSTDATRSILEQYARQDSRIRIIDDGCSLHSASENFMHLLRYATADYCIFCDQDDIWFENKLQVLYDVICTRNQAVPQVVYGNGYMYHCDSGRVEGRSVLKAPERLEDVLFLNGGIQGCALLFNKAMRTLCLDRPEYVVMHDHLFTLAALTFGEFTYVDCFLMLYRRHAATVTDACHGNFKQKTKSFAKKKVTPLMQKDHYRALQSFYAHYAEKMPSEKRKSFELLFSLEKASLMVRFIKLCRGGFRLYNKRSLLLTKLLLRPYMGEKV